MSMTPEQREVYDLRMAGRTNHEIAEQTGRTYKSVKSLWERAQKWADVDPAIQAGMSAVGTNMIPALVWAKTKNEDGTSYSVLLKPERQDFINMRDVIRETIAEVAADVTLNLPKRFDVEAAGMFVLDPADVHIGKLSVKSETGETYDEAIAEHRLVEGSRVLLERAMKDNVSHVAFIMGNDIGHTDSSRKETTSGTKQDVSGSWFSNYRVAQRAYVRIIKMCLEMGLEVIPIFNPSNHDWHTGFTIANSVGLLFKNHENVRVSDYNLSERHRKYLRFGSNLIATAHGDGAREQDLPQLAMVEARGHLDEAPHRYFYLHHYHHKIRKQAGLSNMVREKDHISITTIGSGLGAVEGHNSQIEYVRSPSAPDGWHHRNGYLNRQAVEGFVHHPADGQISRFTRWF